MKQLEMKDRQNYRTYKQQQYSKPRQTDIP